MACRFADAILFEARQWIGLAEEGDSNDGEMLKQALHSVGWVPGEEWCLFSARQIVQNVYQAKGVELPDYLKFQSGSCTAFRAFAQKKAPDKVIYGGVSIGAIGMLLDHGTPRDEFHAFLCLGAAPYKPGHMITAEGNVGNAYRFQTRPIADTLIIVH